MERNQDFEDKLYRALKDDRTVMLGLNGVDDGHSRPMTAQLDGDAGPAIYFFTSKDNGIVQALQGGADSRAIAAFASKGHELFASIEGAIVEDTGNRAVIERLWNPFVAAWYEGKDDPKLALLRLDAERAEVWLDANSLLAGVKMLLGIDPKRDYKDKVREIDLGAPRH